jgi:acyl carrier protein
LNCGLIARLFSSGHGHSHGDSKSDNDYHDRSFNRVSYNRVLSNKERQEKDPIPFMDNMKEKDADYLKPRLPVMPPNKRYEVMVPYDDIRNDRLYSLLDKTEIQARIYNVLRQFDFKALEEIDFDMDYEKELGLDSLEWTALVTSIEHEFHTAFEDTLYEHFRTINDFVNLIEKDYACF